MPSNKLAFAPVLTDSYSELANHYPFFRKEDDNGEYAASEEQGGSSDRSGSIDRKARIRSMYKGGGVVTVSTEFINSVHTHLSTYEQIEKITGKSNDSNSPSYLKENDQIMLRRN